MSVIANGKYQATFQAHVRVRTVYYKVEDAIAVCNWWSNLIGIEPYKLDTAYSEIKVNDLRIGFVCNDWGDQYLGNRCVVMIETDTEESLESIVAQVTKIGGKIVEDNRKTELRSVSVEDPFGNEIEIGNLNHD